MLLPFFCNFEAELSWGWSVAWLVDDLFDLVDEVVGPVGGRLLNVHDVSLKRR